MSDEQNILLLWSDVREREALYKILRATGATVEYLAGDRDIANAMDGKCRLLVIDYDSVRADAEVVLKKLAAMEHPPVALVLTATRDKNDLIDLLSHDVLTNLLAKNVNFLAEELVITVQKIMRNDIFGMEKYLTWGVRPIEIKIKSSADKEPVLDNLDHFLDRIGVNRRLIDLAKGVADEFVMNAVYNAPVDASGKPKYASVSRAQRVDLLENEHAVFRYGCDGRTLALSIEDRFGRLDRTTVRSYLKKCFLKGNDQVDVKDGGAGLGLYCIFVSLNQLVINLAPGRRTEMVGLMDISGSYKQFAERLKSLNLFIEETRIKGELSTNE